MRPEQSQPLEYLRPLASTFFLHSLSCTIGTCWEIVLNGCHILSIPISCIEMINFESKVNSDGHLDDFGSPFIRIKRNLAEILRAGEAVKHFF